MNKRGFTLIELLATIVVLSLVLSISVIGVNFSIKNAKKKTEGVFIGTLRDAIKIYLDDDVSMKNMPWMEVGTFEKSNSQKKVTLYRADPITFNSIINSTYSPIVESDLMNPATEKLCDKNSLIHLYRDSDEVYYYYISRASLVDNNGEYCLLESDETYISNLPENAINIIN